MADMSKRTKTAEFNAHSSTSKLNLIIGSYLIKKKTDEHEKPRC